MRSNVLRIAAVLFFATITAFLVPSPAAHSLWYGTDISEKLEDVTSQGLHDYLVEFVIPELQYPPQADSSNNPDGIRGVRINEPSKGWDGYTLLNCFGGIPSGPNWWDPLYNAILIDMEGNVVNKWMFIMMGLPAKMLPNGDVVGGGITPGMFFEGEVTQLNWDGEEVNRWGKQHHDHQREGNPVGYYAPGMKAETDSGITMWLDRELEIQPQISNFPLEDDVIYQADWEGNIIWEWHAWEHFEQVGGDLGLGFDDNGKWAVMNVRNPAAIEFAFQGATDWTHVNSVSWLGPNLWFNRGHGAKAHGEEGHDGKGDGDKGHRQKDYRFHPDNIIIDYRAMNIIAIIARHDHPEGLWESGDIVWRVGPDYSAAAPEGGLGQIVGLHHAHLIPRGLPGWGNILLFDNGGMAGFGSFFPGMKDAAGGPIGHYPNTHRSYSRVIEFNPVTLEVVWEYSQAKATADYDGDGIVLGNDRKFFAPYYSSAQRLKNGNTLITEGNTGRVFEVTKDNEIVWEYINEHAAGFFGNMLYRAYRVPRWWVEDNLSQ